MKDNTSTPVVIGLTGAIGSGKSNVLATLVALGAEGIDADQVAHQVMAQAGAAYQEVIDAFGPTVVAADGEIDRKTLGQKVFADPGALARLEAIVHPAVFDVVRARIAATATPVVVIEAIKLLEAGFSRQLCDQIWVTACPEAELIARLAASRGMAAEEVRRRLAAQMPPAAMMAQADRVIDTSGTRAETGLLVLAAWVDLDVPFPSPFIRPATLADAAGIAAVLNSVVREGGLTVITRTYTPEEERAYLGNLPPRSGLTVALAGETVAGFQVVEPFAAYTGTMDHVATLGSYLAAPVRGRGWGKAMSRATFAAARNAGFSKLTIHIREDNLNAQVFYSALGFEPCGWLRDQALIEGRLVDLLMFEKFLG